MKYQLFIILALLGFMLSKCSFFSADEASIQKWQLNETPLGSKLSEIKSRHKEELSKNTKHWRLFEYGCSDYYRSLSVDTKNVRQSGYIIKGLLDTRYYFIFPEYVFVTYCFDEHKELTSVIINVEIDGI